MPFLKVLTKERERERERGVKGSKNGRIFLFYGERGREEAKEALLQYNTI